MDWFKKHADSIATIATVIGSMIWMNGKFNALEKDILVIKTVLIMQDIMPKELAVKGEK